MCVEELAISKSVSGFVEWQPKVKVVEETWIRRIADNSRRHGFVPVETAAVEYLSTLQIKGEIDKEIYCLSKLGSTTTRDLALHYDLTIPTARYVAEHQGKLAFPFKRYQTQKVWRGERPQFGRYREFYQADIDIIDVENLPDFYDAEVLCVGIKSMLALGIGAFKVGVSNRKIYEGYLKGLGIEDAVPVLRLIDKIDKVGSDGVQKLLVEHCGMTAQLAERCLALAHVDFNGRTPDALMAELGVNHELFSQGLTELTRLIANVELIADAEVRAAIVADLSFVRGFDYYSGSIFEGKFVDSPTYGSICAGGRYDNLAEGFGTRKLPGVGFSIGLTRILAKLEEKAAELADYPKAGCDFCLILEGDGALNPTLVATGKQLRDQGFTVNTISVAKLKKGLQIAARLESAVAIFEFDQKCVMKKLSTGEQKEVSPGHAGLLDAKAFRES
ncbi:MAG: histidine--tRNA ligase [Deltaproteobacteria bacterium]|nr:histidine--tRNA ligase [Deltaproteobacteria bacterium]